MTEEYKKNLIDYVTKNISSQQGTQKDLNIVNQKYYLYSGDVWSSIRDTLAAIGNPMITGILRSEQFEVSIVYGAIEITNAEDRGFLIYLDKDLKPIQLITQYKTGNNLKGIHKLYIDEDTNRCYGVIGNYYYVESISTKKYFSYFNNLFFKTGEQYEMDLRYSYDLGDNEFVCESITKDPNGSNYLMIGSSGNSKVNSRAIELKINVGSPNEFNRWTSSEPTSHTILVGCYAKYDNNSNPSFKIIRYNYATGCLGLMYNTGSTLNTNDLYDIRTDGVWNFYSVLRPLEYQALSENEIYVTMPLRWRIEVNGETYNGELDALYKYDGSTINEIYRTEVAVATRTGETSFKYEDIYSLSLAKDEDNTLYMFKLYSSHTTNNTNIKAMNLTRHGVIIDENNWINLGSFARLYPVPVALNQTTFLIRKFNICRICNLNSYISYDYEDYVDGFELIIDNLSPINGYNGEPYTSVDSLVPEYANLYSNNDLVFSRNLYNVTKQSNSTMSSVEVPYNYLNDLDIIQNDLISKTNQELINDYTNWNKNIYEIVDVNFLNTINVINEDTNISYLDSAIKVNNAITDGGNTNYQNTPCTKYRLNYTDNTSSIGNITWSDINDLVKQTTISFSPAKEVKSIDLISNDESTIYMTINETFETGKLYTITQKVRIGDKSVKKEVHYQGNNVCYNNKKIEVYSN